MITSCSSLDTEYVKQHRWKHGDGFSVGDWIAFDSSGIYSVSNDTLFKRNVAEATILSVGNQFGGDVEMTIKSISNGETGTYHEK